MIDALLRDLSQPEYVHTLLNPIPVYGLAIAFFGLIVATYFRSRRAQMTALVLIFAAAASAWPVAHYGDEAYDRVLSMADEPGQAWLDAHARRADRLVLVYYTLALIAAAAIFVPAKWPRSATPLLIATIVLAICALAAGGYIAYAGGKIRHREFRNVPPPPKPPDTAR
jgi:hypothetical protein